MIDKKQSTVSEYSPPAPLPISEAEKQQYHSTLRNYFDSTLLGPYRNFNGGILVAKGGTVLFEDYHGFEDLPAKTRPLTAKSSLHIASSSKPFTAVAILGLIQQGKLSLTDTLNQFFPTLPYPGITIRDLLTHRSGLPNYLYFMEASSWNKQQM
ncbi:MAG: class A beta-lactamase-related serine hydrolase, partial [Chitinophagia bacterium]|nr:class A beta-lactamase-related serine hydrolase [Chitinophagia bacterium]